SRAGEAELSRVLALRLPDVDRAACEGAGGCMRLSFPHATCRLPCDAPAAPLPPAPPKPPELPLPPAAANLLPCRAGWTAVTSTVPSYCEPPPAEECPGVQWP